MVYGRTFYYVFGTCQGKTVAMGAYNTEEEARREGFSRSDWDSGYFDVKAYHTRDLQEAIRRWKHEHSHNTQSIFEGMQRISHG